MCCGFFVQGQMLPDTIFYDIHWKQCSHDDYTYYRLIEKSKDAYIVRDYYKTGQLQMEGPYTSINPEWKNGFFTYYYSSGQKETEGDYYNNKKRGTFRNYSPSGTLTSSTEYKNGMKNGRSVQYFPNDIRAVTVYENDEPKNSTIEGMDWAKAKSKAINSHAPGSDREPFTVILRKNFDRMVTDSSRAVSCVIMVKFMIDENGSPIEINPEMNENKKQQSVVTASISELAKWQSYMVDGKAVKTKCMVMVQFPEISAVVDKSRIPDSIRSSVTTTTVINGVVHTDTTEYYGPKNSTEQNQSFEQLFKKYLAAEGNKERVDFTSLLKKNIKADTSGIISKTGVVTVKFWLDMDGAAKDIIVEKSTDEKQKALVLQTINGVPKWHTTTKDSDLLFTAYTITVEFPELRINESQDFQRGGTSSHSYTTTTVSPHDNLTSTYSSVTQQPVKITMPPVETDSLSTDFKAFVKERYQWSGLTAHGTVMLKFTVSAEGKASAVTLFSNDNAKLGTFATDVIMQYKKWVPDTVKDHPVKTEYRLMVGFPSLKIFSLSRTPSVE